jgi:hypothetical protein
MQTSRQQAPNETGSETGTEKHAAEQVKLSQKRQVRCRRKCSNSGPSAAVRALNRRFAIRQQMTLLAAYLTSAPMPLYAEHSAFLQRKGSYASLCTPPLIFQSPTVYLMLDHGIHS